MEEEEEEEAYLRTSPAPLPLLSLSSFPSCLVRLSSPTHCRRRIRIAQDPDCVGIIRKWKGGVIWSGWELKHRLLQQMGYALVVVPYWEWNQVSGDQASEADYLRGKLDASCVRAQASSHPRSSSSSSLCRTAQGDEPRAAAEEGGGRMAGNKRARDRGSDENPWTVAYSKRKGRSYYFNRVTRESRWSHPDSQGGRAVETGHSKVVVTKSFS